MRPISPAASALLVLSTGLFLVSRPALAFELFVAHEPVYAFVDGELFEGEAHARLNRSGKLAVQSTRNPLLRCEGTFHFTHATSGEASLQCSDGLNLQLGFEALGIASGHGHSLTTRGPLSFTFGLSPEKALPYLHLPAGKLLRKTSEGVRLSDG
jgi:hypothetical protein